MCSEKNPGFLEHEGWLKLIPPTFHIDRRRMSVEEALVFYTTTHL